MRSMPTALVLSSALIAGALVWSTSRPAHGDTPPTVVCETLGKGFSNVAPNLEGFISTQVAAGRTNLFTPGIDGMGNATICAW